MEVLWWIGNHWLELVETLGIAGLYFTARTIRLEIKSRKLDYLIELTKQHRDIWMEVYRRPELMRVSKQDVDIESDPITPEEELFVNFLILHLSASYQAFANALFSKPEALSADIRQFFSNPIPQAVWRKLRHLQNSDFVEFVEGCIEIGVEERAA